MVTSQQHKYDIWASNLLFLAFGLSVGMGYLRHRGYFANDLQPKDYITLYLINPILLACYYYIRKGLRPVKTLFLTLYGLVLIQIIRTGSPVFSDASLKTFDFVSQHFLQLGASLLMLLSLWSSKHSGNQPSRTASGATTSR